MEKFDKLVHITDHLLGPEGCPWDREQTLKSIRSSLLEEACEVIDAINGEDDEHLVDELGDLFFNALFLSRLAEIEGRGSLDMVLAAITSKLIRRHPHVFGDVKIDGTQGVREQWEALKGEEKGHQKRKSAIDGIPKGLPALARAQKVLLQAKKRGFDVEEAVCGDSFGKRLLRLVWDTSKQDLEAEQELREETGALEESFRRWEEKMRPSD